MDIALVILIFVYYLFNREEESALPEYNWVIHVLIAFNVLLIIASMLNYKYIYLKPALSQLAMYNEPFILFLSIVNLPLSEDDIYKYKKLFIFLLVIEIAIGILQLSTYYATRDSESIIGTFQHNAEQYAAFILLGIYYIIGKSKSTDQLSIMHYVAIFFIISMILLIDNKASWIGVALSILFIYNLFIKSGEIITEKLKYVAVLAIIAILGSIVVINRSGTIHRFGRIYESYSTGKLFELGKLKAYKDIIESYGNNILMSVVGSGPATFYSRSSRQYYFLTEDMYYAGDFEQKKIEEYQSRESNAMGGVISKYDKEPYFYKYYRNSKIYMVGSGQIDEPYSSIAALLGETGILGAILYLSLYLIVLNNMCKYLIQYRFDEFIFPMIVVTVGFIVYTLGVSFYNNWMETGRMMTILWSLAGIVIKYCSMKKPKEVLSDHTDLSWYEVPQNT